MATEKQLAEIKLRWSTYESREQERFRRIKTKLNEAGFSAEDLTTIKYLL